MEEMMNKFYEEYAKCWKLKVEAEFFREHEKLHPNIYLDCEVKAWDKIVTRCRHEISELRRVAAIFGADFRKLSEIEEKVLSNRRK